MSQASEFISIRLDGELKTELQQAAEMERRSLSNFSRLLLEYAWGEYLGAGSMRNLLDRKNHTEDTDKGKDSDKDRSQKWPFKP